MAKFRKHWLIRIALPIIVVLAAVGIVAYLLVSHDSKLNNKPYTSASTSGKRTAATSQPTSIQSQTSSNLTPGSVQDENGQSINNLPPSADWASSSNGQITLQEPTKNLTIASGDTITGIANVSQVSFILTDNSVGLIDEGNLNVVNGRFTGKLAFTAHSSSGKLEVYYPNPINGAEENVVEIDVNLSSS